MPDVTITIPLDVQTARAYSTASLEERTKIEALLGVWLRALAARQFPSLQKTLDEIGRKAGASGLTPEILETLLEGEQL
jgi:hypothetical protein